MTYTSLPATVHLVTPITNSIATHLSCSTGENNIEIKNLEKLKLLKNQNIFHAGTLKTENNITVSNGGRVLNFVSISDDFSKCREEAINLIEKLNWENGYFRRDIGHNVIKK